MGYRESLDNYAKRCEKVYACGTKPVENWRTIKLYVKKEGHKGLSAETQKIDYNAFALFSSWCDIPINDLTEIDILDFLDFIDAHTYNAKGRVKGYSVSSIHRYKTVYRKFFRTIGKADLSDLFKCKQPPRNNENKKRENLLTKTDVEAMIDAATSYRDKALIATLYESGARRGDVMSCRLKDLVFDSSGVKVTFPEGKTGPRTVRLIYAASYLRAWKENHPCRQNSEPDPDAFLCIGLHSKKHVDSVTGEITRVYERMTTHGFSLQIQKIAERAGVTKKVHPHMFRHSRATELAEYFSDQQLKQYLGWAPGSSMAAVYIHNPDTENALLKMYGLEIDEKTDNSLKVGRCPRCHDVQPSTALYCGKCGTPLQDTVKTKIESEVAEIDIEIIRAALLDPSVLEEIAKRVNKKG